MSKRRRRPFTTGPWPCAVTALLACAPQAAAQDAPEPDAAATTRFGPLALRSTIALSSLGVDTNVFNTSDADHPQSDFTMTFTPTADAWLRLGRTWISGRIDVDWVYYRRFASERSANSTYQIGVARKFNRLALDGGVSRLNTRDRPGFEIDARSQRLETDWSGSVELRAFARTFVGVKAVRRRVEFDREAVFRDASLAEELNRTRIARALVVRHQFTTLTTTSLEVGRERDRFVFSPFRDADSTRVAGAVDFQPLAKINGNASVGYRHLAPLARDVAPFRVATAAVNLSYTLMGATRFGVEAARDVQPSFEFDQPYYLETGIGGSVQQRIYGPVDVLLRAGTRRLAYRDRIGAVADVSNRLDRVGLLGLGAGYRLGADKRIGFTIDRQRRTSSVAGYRYSGLHAGFSLTYER